MRHQPPRPVEGGRGRSESTAMAHTPAAPSAARARGPAGGAAAAAGGAGARAAHAGRARAAPAPVHLGGRRGGRRAGQPGARARHPRGAPGRRAAAGAHLRPGAAAHGRGAERPLVGRPADTAAGAPRSAAIRGIACSWPEPGDRVCLLRHMGRQHALAQAAVLMPGGLELGGGQRKAPGGVQAPPERALQYIHTSKNALKSGRAGCHTDGNHLATSNRCSAARALPGSGCMRRHNEFELSPKRGRRARWHLTWEPPCALGQVFLRPAFACSLITVHLHAASIPCACMQLCDRAALQPGLMSSGATLVSRQRFVTPEE